MSTTRRGRAKPKRPYRAKWFSEIIQFGRRCTPRGAWTDAQNVFALYDALVEISVQDKRERADPKDVLELPRSMVGGMIDYIQSTWARKADGTFRIGDQSRALIRWFKTRSPE